MNVRDTQEIMKAIKDEYINQTTREEKQPVMPKQKAAVKGNVPSISYN